MTLESLFFKRASSSVQEEVRKTMSNILSVSQAKSHQICTQELFLHWRMSCWHCYRRCTNYMNMAWSPSVRVPPAQIFQQQQSLPDHTGISLTGYFCQQSQPISIISLQCLATDSSASISTRKSS